MPIHLRKNIKDSKEMLLRFYDDNEKIFCGALPDIGLARISEKKSLSPDPSPYVDDLIEHSKYVEHKHWASL